MVRRPKPPEPPHPVGSDETDRLPRVVLDARALDDYDLLSVGAFRPLATFMGEADYHSCLGQMRLANGRLFPIPITLPGGEESRVGSRVALVHPRGETLATLDVEEVFAIDPWEALGGRHRLRGGRGRSAPRCRDLRRNKSLSGGARQVPRPWATP